MSRSAVDVMWRFARGDMAAADFEAWLIASEDVERVLRKTAYLDLLDFDTRHPREAANARAFLKEVLHHLPEASCECLQWRDSQKLPLGFDTAVDWFCNRFEVIRARTPWLQAVRCRNCSEYWYVATDTIDDDYYFRRITADVAARARKGEWPSYFDNAHAFWPTSAWLRLHGFKSLEEWQVKNGGG